MVIQDIEAQWLDVMQKIKKTLEELGTSLNNIVKMTIFVKGPFPEGVGKSLNCRLDVVDTFFKQYCPELADDQNPPPAELIGVECLDHPDMVVEIVVVAALPD
jgi:enamine deaminase RidA (YjgF/YER057c/UK114 family)